MTNMPSKVMQAATQKGVAKLNQDTTVESASCPPMSGPMMNPKEMKAFKSPKWRALDSGVLAVSTTTDCPIVTLPSQNPQRANPKNSVLKCCCETEYAVM